MTSSEIKPPNKPDDQLADLVVRLTEESELNQGERGRLLASLAGLLAAGAREAGSITFHGGRWLADQMEAIAPRLPIRDQATLRRQHPGLSPEQLADAIIASASKASMAIGAAVGMTAFAAFLPSMPFQLAAETLTVSAIEIKMVAELHEVYGLRPAGGRTDRTVAYLHSWSTARGLKLINPGSLSTALKGPLKRHLQHRLMKQAGRNTTSLVPFFGGAVIAAVLNRRETRKLAESVRNDLRDRSGIAAHW